MKCVLKYAFAFTLLILAGSVMAQAAAPLSRKDSKKLAAGISADYQQWHELSVKGKLKLEGAPISPSVKLYMVRDSLIVLSASAPFVGEAARVEMDRDSIFMYNKMAHTMTRLPMDALRAVFPGDLVDFQEFLLGNVVVCGHGNLSEKNVSGVDCYPLEPEEEGQSGAGWLVMPKSSWQPDGARYGYVISEDLRPESMVVELDNSDDYAQIDYIYGKNSTTFSFVTAHGSRTLECDLTLEAPSDRTQPISPLHPDGKYTVVPFKKLLKF